MHRPVGSSFRAATRSWAKIMEDHAEFIAHLLDPQEKTLIAVSRKSADLFNKLRTEHKTTPT